MHFGSKFDSLLKANFWTLVFDVMRMHFWKLAVLKAALLDVERNVLPEALHRAAGPMHASPSWAPRRGCRR